MGFIFLSILPFFFWSLVNIHEKYAVVHRVKNPIVLWVWQVILGLVLLVATPFVPGFWSVDGRTMLLLVVTGVLYFFAALPFFRAIQIEEISRVGVFWNLVPVFSLLLTSLFLDETLTQRQLVAFIFLFAGAVVASLHIGKGRFRFSKALPLMALCTFMYASAFILFDLILVSTPFLTAYLWLVPFMFLSSLTLFASRTFRSSFWEETKQLTGSLSAIVCSIAVLDRAGIFFSVWAVSLGPSALVFGMEGFQSIFMFLFATLLSFFAPRIVKEELDKKNVFMKVLALILLLVGIGIAAF